VSKTDNTTNKQTNKGVVSLPRGNGKENKGRKTEHNRTSPLTTDKTDRTIQSIPSLPPIPTTHPSPHPPERNKQKVKSKFDWFSLSLNTHS